MSLNVKEINSDGSKLMRRHLKRKNGFNQKMNVKYFSLNSSQLEKSFLTLFHNKNESRVQ